MPLSPSDPDEAGGAGPGGPARTEPSGLPSVDRLLRLFRESSTIAVVGASGDPEKKAHAIPAYLQSQGYRIIPVNPTAGELFGVRAVPSLSDVEEPIDVVEVFRPSEEAPGIAAEAVAAGAKVLWLQLGVVSEEAAEIARAGGMLVVMNACMGAVHRKLVRRHGLEGT